MNVRIIRAPSPATLELIKRRMGLAGDISIDDVDTIGLIQGKVIDMICAADIAEKTSGVRVFDVRGVCPQHMTVLALFGDTAAVQSALSKIEAMVQEDTYHGYSQTH